MPLNETVLKLLPLSAKPFCEPVFLFQKNKQDGFFLSRTKEPIYILNLNEYRFPTRLVYSANAYYFAGVPRFNKYLLLRMRYFAVWKWPILASYFKHCGVLLDRGPAVYGLTMSRWHSLYNRQRYYEAASLFRLYQRTHRCLVFLWVVYLWEKLRGGSVGPNINYVRRHELIGVIMRGWAGRRAASSLPAPPAPNAALFSIVA